MMPEVGLPWELFTWRHLEWHGQLNLLKGALVFSDAAVTVSPTHAHELRTIQGGFGLHDVFVFISLRNRFTGIINGIDFEEWNPETDTLHHLAVRQGEPGREETLQGGATTKLRASAAARRCHCLS